MNTTDNSSDNGTVGGVSQREYSTFTNLEKFQMQMIENKGAELHVLFEKIGTSREMSIAKTKIEEAVMWAREHLTNTPHLVGN